MRVTAQHLNAMMVCCHTLQEMTASTSGAGGPHIFGRPIPQFRCSVHFRQPIKQERARCQLANAADARRTVVALAKKRKDSDTINALREGEVQ